jgi:hypothetical protein
LGFKAGSDKEWKPTSNDRNNMMVKEAKKFAVHIKNLHKDISTWIKSIDGGRSLFNVFLALTKLINNCLMKLCLEILCSEIPESRNGT